MSHTIALISAVQAAIPPAQAALEAVPDAEVWNILDDRLLTDAEVRGGVDDHLRARMERLIDHAVAGGADAVLLTCSMYGWVARELNRPVLVLAPDQAAFDAIVESAPPRLLVIASFPAALEDSCARLIRELADAGTPTIVEGTVVGAAKDAAAKGDVESLGAAIVASIEARATPVDAVFLAQYSLAPAADAVACRTGVRVFTGPGQAAARITAAFTAEL